MSYELYNLSTALCRKFSRQFWAKALELARLYDWQPLGTCLMAGADFHKSSPGWNGTYLTNDGQTILAEDAYSLADALERSLDDIPDDKIKLDWDYSAWLEDDLPEWLSPAERELVEEELEDGLLDIMGTHPLDFFAGREKYYLVQFIRFCRLGSFQIL
jgi:hypothetical protein